MEAALIGSRELDRHGAMNLLLPISALAVGIISFGPWWWTIGLSIFFPVLLFKADSRMQAFFIALFYHMGATRSLALGAAKFYDDSIFFGLTIWALGNAFNGLIYGALWHRHANIRIFTITLGILATALPPLGVLGWANPLTAAGVFFPGTGIAGLLYILGLYVCLAARSRGFLNVFVLLGLWCQITSKVSKVDEIAGLSTSFQKTEDQGQGDFERQRSLMGRVRNVKEKIVVLPEGILSGGWSEAGERLWAKEKKTVLLGVDLKLGRSENIMVDSKRGKVYQQRQPLPFSMWRPFDSTSYAAQWFESPTIEVDGQKLAPLICYEGFLVWPVVHSYLAGATHIIATGNYWWAKHDGLPVIHESIIKSWSRLFSMPFAMAVNL